MTNRNSLSDDCDSSTWNTLLSGVALLLHLLLLHLWWRELFQNRPRQPVEERGDANTSDIRVRGQSFDWGSARDGSNARLMMQGEGASAQLTARRWETFGESSGEER